MSFSASSVEKVGTIKLFGGSTAPDGWLFCDTSAISRTLYAGLFAEIGTTYGAGDGTTTFNLPDGNNFRLIGSQTVAIKGNGIALGFTDGNKNFGLNLNSNYFRSSEPAYGASVGSSVVNGEINNIVPAITTDSTKSGLVGTINSSSQYRMIIKY